MARMVDLLSMRILFDALLLHCHVGLSRDKVLQGHLNF